MYISRPPALNMESSLMVRCPQTRPLAGVMIPSTPSSQKLDLENMSPELSLLIWNQQWLMKSELVPTVSCFTLNS